MARLEQVADLWKEWGVQALVLFSFSLQVTLLILAEFRHRVDSGVLRFFTWSAYQLADATAIYVLGHMSVTSRSPEHELVAFWAPFLLMHLGGQDNITAYAVEDNQLWLRHLQMLAVQVAAAAYVIYVSYILSSGQPLMQLQAATIIMFVVGVVKYGERVWALLCASGSESGHNYRQLERAAESDIHFIYHPTNRSASEDIVFLGHELLGVPKDFLKGPVPYLLDFRLWDRLAGYFRSRKLHLHEDQAYKVAELQVSLMYDVFYTKFESQWGCIRIVSSLGTAVALSLLLPLLSRGSNHIHSHGSYNKVDVVITYVLSVGAAALEAVSLLRYMLSSCNWYRCERKFENLRRRFHLRYFFRYSRCNWFQYPMRKIGRRVITSLRRLIHAADRRRRHSWSRSMGQHNLLQVCARSKASWSSKVARMMGVEDWWNTLASSWSVPVSPLIEQLVMKQVLEGCDHIHNLQSRAAFQILADLPKTKWKSQQVYDDLHLSIDHDKLSFEKSILLWHIATDLYLRWYKDQPKGDLTSSKKDDHLAEAVEALSNYMLFLVAARPHMLPAPTNRKAYVEMCYILTGLRHRSAEDLAGTLLSYGNALNTGSEIEFPFSAGEWRLNVRGYLETNPALVGGCKLAVKLIIGESPSDMLELIGKVLVEMLCFVGNRCSAYSHVKQLSEGGELITIAAFLVEYNRRRLLRGD